MAEFSNDHDRLFRSHFLHTNQLADRSYEHVQAVYELGLVAANDPSLAGRRFEDVERDLEAGWLNVRVGGGSWAAVREFARAGFDSARQGRVDNTMPAGNTPPFDRVSYSDPVADGIDPTSPESPEQQG